MSGMSYSHLQQLGEFRGTGHPTQTGLLRLSFWERLNLQLDQILNVGLVSWDFSTNDATLGLCFFSLAVPRSGIGRSYGNSMFNKAICHNGFVYF